MVLFDSKLEDPKKHLFEVPVDTALHHVAGHASKSGFERNATGVVEK